MSFSNLNKTSEELMSFMNRQSDVGEALKKEFQKIIEGYAGYSEIPTALELILTRVVKEFNDLMNEDGFDMNNFNTYIGAGYHATICGRSLRFLIHTHGTNVSILLEDGIPSQRYGSYTPFETKTVDEWGDPVVRRVVFIKGLLIYHRAVSCRACGKLLIRDETNLCNSCEVGINAGECCHCGSRMGSLEKGKGRHKGSLIHPACKRLR